MIKSSVTVSLVFQIKNGPWIYQEPLEVSIEKAASLGFDGVELFTTSADAVDSNTLDNKLKRNNIRLSAVGTGAGKVIRGLTLTHPDPHVRHEAITFVSDMIRFGAHFCAPAIIGSMQGSLSPDFSKEQSLSWLVEGLNFLGKLAWNEGVNLIFEPLNRYETNLINTLEDGVSIINMLDCLNVKLLADLFHMNIEEKSIRESIMEFGKSIGHVHFADSNRRPVGMGHLSVIEIAKALKLIGYDGYISAEALAWPNSDAAAVQTIQSFKKYFAE